MAPSDRGELLDASFVRELEVLRRRLEIRARSGASGERVARRKGSSAEFQEHRAYAPGDDLRRIDWAAYARTGEPVLKLFRAEEDVVVRIVCDASASMSCGEPPKSDVARKLAAAIAYMALARSERAQLVVAAEQADWYTPQRGRSGLAAFLRSLTAAPVTGGTDLAAAIDTTVRRSPRPGLVAIISDFFDAGPVFDALARASTAGHEVALLQVLAPEEVEPAFEGDLMLEDAESGRTVEVTMDAASLEAYALRFAGLCEELRQFARRHRATYVRARTDEPLEEVVRRFVSKDVD
ncbi:MAG: DUF58 domain-containing protein [Polyangiaceae bacterium]